MCAFHDEFSMHMGNFQKKNKLWTTKAAVLVMSNILSKFIVLSSQRTSSSSLYLVFECLVNMVHRPKLKSTIALPAVML